MHCILHRTAVKIFIIDKAGFGTLYASNIEPIVRPGNIKIDKKRGKKKNTLNILFCNLYDTDYRFVISQIIL